MAALKLTPNVTIGDNYPIFIIAEIGQNHQGDLKIAKQMIKIAKECGVDCVKFQKSCLSEKFNKRALERPYSGLHSWGATYGEHKRHLEFDEEQYRELQQCAKELDVMFTASAMDSKSLDFLQKLEVPFIKIGSGDSNNLELIEKAASSGLPLVISTGMVEGENDIDAIYETVGKYHKNFALLHCISAYPTPSTEANLRAITRVRERYSDIVIGYSGHESGTVATLGAVALGARIIERHFTLDRNQRGSDHRCSLEPHHLAQLVADIHEMERSIRGDGIRRFSHSEKECKAKLGKSVVAGRQLAVGQILRVGDLKVKVAEPRGIDGKFLGSLYGKKMTREVGEDETVDWSDLIDL